MNQLVCTACGEGHPLLSPRWRCECGGLLDIEFEARFDQHLIAKRPPTLWRYREALPILDDGDIVSMGEGFTPLLALEFGGKRVWVKQDHLEPSGSYKDRGASVLVSQAKALGMAHVVEDSSGNAGAAVAAYCARAGISCEIYVPEATSPAKLAQIASYGAKMRVIAGSRQDTADAVMAAAETTYYASHSWNPFFFQGTKTWAYEVCEGLGWRSPDAVVLPVGNGTLLLGARIGFADLVRAGIISRLPRIVAVQAANCAPLASEFLGPQGAGASPCAETIAEGIAIAQPVRGRQILQAVRDTGGTFIVVSEEEIVAAHVEMCGRGFYIEPTSAATIAGLHCYLDGAPGEEIVATTLTGHGLKTGGKH